MAWKSAEFLAGKIKMISIAVVVLLLESGCIAI